MAKLEGREKVARVFRTLPDKAVDRITRALNKSANEIRDRAELLAPRDASTPIDLKDDIKVEIGTRINRRRRETSGPNSVAAYVVAGGGGQRLIAAIKQEFGRPPGPGSHPGHAAQPFMFPAYASVRTRVRRRIQRAIRQAVREVLNRV